MNNFHGPLHNTAPIVSEGTSEVPHYRGADFMLRVVVTTKGKIKKKRQWKGEAHKNPYVYFIYVSSLFQIIRVYPPFLSVQLIN